MKRESVNAPPTSVEEGISNFRQIRRTLEMHEEVQLSQRLHPHQCVRVFDSYQQRLPGAPHAKRGEVLHGGKVGQAELDRKMCSQREIPQLLRVSAENARK